MDEYEYLAALDHIREWNASCRRADLKRGARGKDIGRAGTLNYLRAHGRDDLEGVE